MQTVSSSTVEFFSGPQINISGAQLELTYQPVQALRLDGELTVLHGHQPVAVQRPPAHASQRPADVHIVERYTNN